jgi:holin-like protein
MIKQCAIIFGCLFMGELLVYLTGIKVPSSIVGMLLLTAFLKFRVIKLQQVKSIADLFISNLAFFFIPPGVAIMLYFDLLKKELAAIVIASFVSTLIVLAVTGWVYQKTRKNDE